MSRTAVFEDDVEWEPHYGAPHCTSRGDARSALFHPDGFSLWKVNGELDAGTELTWGTDHGDEGIFVISGELEFDGRVIGADGALIVEAGVSGTVRARRATSLVHFGGVERNSPSDGPLGPPAVEGRHVHVFDTADAEALRIGDHTYYSDGGCPTCRLMLFTVDRRDDADPSSSGSHKHSADEIIHILDGAMNVGRVRIVAGGSVAVPGDLRYGFTAPAGLRFVNYRRDASTVVFAPGDEPHLECRARIAAKLASGERSS